MWWGKAEGWRGEGRQSGWPRLSLTEGAAVWGGWTRSGDGGADGWVRTGPLPCAVALAVDTFAARGGAAAWTDLRRAADPSPASLARAVAAQARAVLPPVALVDARVEGAEGWLETNAALARARLGRHIAHAPPLTVAATG